MNKVSFLDELVKTGCCRHLLKRANEGGSESSEIPQGMASGDPVPDSLDVHPTEAKTRLPLTAHLPSPIHPGIQGGVTQAKNPIDRFRFNRSWKDDG
jgi:hypothetical protein